MSHFALDVPAALLEAKDFEHSLEIAKLKMLLVCYREIMEEHGIEPPDPSGEELLQMYRDCRAVISSASDFIARLGTAKELLSERLWRDST